MTASTHSSPQKPSPLRVMPPPSQVAPPPPSPEPLTPKPPAPVPEAPAPEQLPSQGKGRWKIGLILVGLGLIGLIPVPYNIGGHTTLEWPEGERQPVRPPMKAIVQEVWVEPGQRVTPGQILVTLYSHELKREQDDLARQLAQARRELEDTRRSQVQAQGRLQEVQATATVAQNRAQRAQDRQGAVTPELEALQWREQELLVQLDERRVQLERRQTLYDQGAVSAEDRDGAAYRYQEVQTALERNRSEMGRVRQTLADQAQDELGSVSVQVASVEAATLLAQMDGLIRSQEAKIITLEAQLADLADREAALILRANQAGTVLNDDLDLRVGEEVEPSSVLMRIADVQQLTGNVAVNEEDVDFVAMEAPVTFRAKQAKLDPYQATVEKITYEDFTPDDTRQRRVAMVRVVIDNPDERLRPGASGYAKIASLRMSIYRRIGREIIKLVPERFLP